MTTHRTDRSADRSTGMQLLRRVGLTAVVLAATLAVGGCRGNPFHKMHLERSTISTDEIERLHRDYIKKDVAAEFAKKQDADKATYRDEVVNSRLRYVDAHYEAVVRQLYYGRAGKDFGVDIAVLSLNTVGGLTGTAATKAILHAISGGLIGANASLDSQFFQDQATNSIVQKMDASRSTELQKIKMKLDLPATSVAGKPGYGIAEALGDVDAYFRAGTATRALLELSKSTAAEAKIAEDALSNAETKLINAKRQQSSLAPIE